MILAHAPHERVTYGTGPMCDTAPTRLLAESYLQYRSRAFSLAYIAILVLIAGLLAQLVEGRIVTLQEWPGHAVMAVLVLGSNALVVGLAWRASRRLSSSRSKHILRSGRYLSRKACSARCSCLASCGNTASATLRFSSEGRFGAPTMSAASDTSSKRFFLNAARSATNRCASAVGVHSERTRSGTLRIGYMRSEGLKKRT